jgi:putative membrane protein
MEKKYRHVWFAAALLTGGCTTMQAQIQSSGAMGSQDTAYITTAYELAQLDDVGGKLAASKAQDPRVVDVSSQLMAQAEALTPGLKMAIKAVGETPPETLSPHESAELDKLKTLKGSAFDQTYIADEVALHKRAIDVFEKEDRDTKNATMRTQVEAELPAVETDLAKLQALTAPQNPHPFG